VEKINLEEIWDVRNVSAIWEKYCLQAKAFDPLRIREIQCILPMPDDKEGVLIIADDTFFFNKESTMKTVQRYAFAHCFPDYPVLSSVIKDIGAFGKYKLPWACPYFTLFPLEGGENSIWVNPLMIENVYQLEGSHYLQLLNGLKLEIPVQRYYALLRAEIACAVFAALRQDSAFFSTDSNRPLSYLPLPNTAFAQSLAKRPLLDHFVTRKGELHRRYQRACFLHYYDELENNLLIPDWENWQ